MATEGCGNMEYFIVVFVKENMSYYCIWISSNDDRFLTFDGNIVFWKSLSELMNYCEQENIILDSEEITEYNLDDINKWCNSNDMMVDCNDIINYWNIFSDASKSINQSFSGDIAKMNSIYEKLFYGNNLSSINLPEKSYEPIFSDEEVATIKSILQEGINFVKVELQ